MTDNASTKDTIEDLYYEMQAKDARINELESKLDYPHDEIAAMQKRISLLEANLQQLRSGTDLPFPAVTDRHLIEAAIDNGKRIALLEADRKRLFMLAYEEAAYSSFLSHQEIVSAANALWEALQDHPNA